MKLQSLLKGLQSVFDNDVCPVILLLVVNLVCWKFDKLVWWEKVMFRFYGFTNAEIRFVCFNTILWVQWHSSVVALINRKHILVVKYQELSFVHVPSLRKSEKFLMCENNQYPITNLCQNICWVGVQCELVSEYCGGQSEGSVTVSAARWPAW